MKCCGAQQKQVHVNHVVNRNLIVRYDKHDFLFDNKIPPLMITAATILTVADTAHANNKQKVPSETAKICKLLIIG